MNKKLDRKIINNEIIFYLNISKVLSSNNKEKEKKERFDKKYNQIKINFIFSIHFINIFIKFFINSFINKMKFEKDKYYEFKKNKERILIYGEDKYECLNSTLDAKFPAEIHKVQLCTEIIIII